jgi:copper chaperone NosL
MADWLAWRTLAWALALSITALTACSGDPGSGPLDVKWDRIPCERCRMVLSDRKHAAQVRVPQAEGRSRVLFFDDIGCAVVWLEDQPARDDPRTEIWVAEWRTGDWIDARKAHYLAGQVTPMEYGLGAQAEPDPQAFGFDAAKERIFEVERKYNVHGGHLDSAPGPGADAAVEPVPQAPDLQQR